MIEKEKTFGTGASAKAGIDIRTTRIYSRLPSELKKDHWWRTRKELFEDTRVDIESKLEIVPALKAKKRYSRVRITFSAMYQ